jgi:hypothetical protein
LACLGQLAASCNWDNVWMKNTWIHRRATCRGWCFVTWSSPKRTRSLFPEVLFLNFGILYMYEIKDIFCKL